MIDRFLYLQLMLGDIVISVETAARQAEERGHTLLDEIRILLVCYLIDLFIKRKGLIILPLHLMFEN